MLKVKPDELRQMIKKHINETFDGKITHFINNGLSIYQLPNNHIYKTPSALTNLYDFVNQFQNVLQFRLAYPLARYFQIDIECLLHMVSDNIVIDNQMYHIIEKYHNTWEPDLGIAKITHDSIINGVKRKMRICTLLKVCSYHKLIELILKKLNIPTNQIKVNRIEDIKKIGEKKIKKENVKTFDIILEKEKQDECYKFISSNELRSKINKYMFYNEIRSLRRFLKNLMKSEYESENTYDFWQPYLKFVKFMRKNSNSSLPLNIIIKLSKILDVDLRRLLWVCGDFIKTDDVIYEYITKHRDPKVSICNNNYVATSTIYRLLEQKYINCRISTLIRAMYELNKQKVNEFVDMIVKRLGITKEEQNEFVEETVIDNSEDKRKGFIKENNTQSEGEYLKYRFELIKQIINCDKCKECNIDKLEFIKTIMNINDNKIQELIDIMDELNTDIAKAKWISCLIKQY